MRSRAEVPGRKPTDHAPQEETCEDPTVRVLLGDARHMDRVGDASVHLVITSPPYWQLKDYGASDQVGFADSYEEYVNHLNLVWGECHRVLHPGCRLCVNVGDQFARAAHYGRYKVIPIRTEVIRFCETVGFDYMGAVIWQKVTTTNTTGGGAVMGSYPHPRNGIVKLDYEFILLFRKLGRPPVVSRERKEASQLTAEEWGTHFSGHWNFPGERQQGHLAMFPEELPRRLTRMFSFVGETVLDPFLGSGTTCLAARRLGRNAIGYEINADFLPAIEDKLGAGSFGVERPSAPSRGMLDASLAALPYQFVDPVRVERRVDSRREHFGSRVDGKEKRRTDLRRVRDVTSPDTLILDDDTAVRLLGVVPLKGREAQAVARLWELVRGQQVYVRPDPRCESGPMRETGPAGRESQGAGDAPLVYLYLKNRTPVNRHLIRSGLVTVDRSRSYRFREAFCEERRRARSS